jgi:hypothetical protein
MNQSEFSNLGGNVGRDTLKSKNYNNIFTVHPLSSAGSSAGTFNQLRSSVAPISVVNMS